MTLSQLADQIAAAGIPIITVHKSGSLVTIDFQLQATQQQRADAQAIVDTFDWSMPMQKSTSELADDIAAHPDKDRILELSAAQLLLDNPDLLADAGIALTTNKAQP